MRFKDKVAVVLGGNSGIGLASAKAFASEGAKVVITGRNPETLQAAALEIGGDVLALQSDIADLDAHEALIEQVRAKHGRIDVLFVNAGVGAFIPFEEVTPENYDQIFSVNMRGPYFVIQKALPLLGEGAAIVLCSSIGHCSGLPGNSVYAASKAGMRSLARNLGAELVGRGIRVNCLSPGPTDTPIITRSNIADIDGMKAQMRAVVPMKRMGEPEEIARAVLFLASTDASFITGIDLLVDGGLISF